MTPIELLALSLGLGWASGLNLYAAVFVVGLLGASGSIDLPVGLMPLTHPALISFAGLMYLAEFFVDKIPGLDSGWDAIHTFIRIPAGAVLAAAAIGTVDPVWLSAATLAGGSLATVSHSAKAGGRVLINTSPEPVTNWTASVAEDVTVLGGLWAALNYPVVFIFAVMLFTLGALYFLKFTLRLTGAAIKKVRSWFDGGQRQAG